jgi:hypothetical protein
MTLRDDMLPVVTAGRTLANDLGLRRYQVRVVTVTAPGTTTADLGSTGTETSITLTPPPRVRETPDRNAESFGTYESGDITVDRIDSTYTRAQLDTGAGCVWRIGAAGDLAADLQSYRLLSLHEHNFKWVAKLRRTTNGNRT